MKIVEDKIKEIETKGPFQGKFGEFYVHQIEIGEDVCIQYSKESLPIGEKREYDGETLRLEKVNLQTGQTVKAALFLTMTREGEINKIEKIQVRDL